MLRIAEVLSFLCLHDARMQLLVIHLHVGLLQADTQEDRFKTLLSEVFKAEVLS